MANNDGNKGLVVSSVVAFFVRVIGALSGFFVTLVVARTLNSEESGLYFLAFTVVTFLAVFSGVGLENTVLRYVGSSAAYTGDVFRKSLIVVLPIGSLTGFVLYLSADGIAQIVFDKPNLAPVLQAMSAGVVGLSTLTLIAMALQGLRKIPISIWILNISVNSMLIVYVYFGSVASAAILAFAYSSGTIVTVICGFFLLWFFKPKVVGESVAWSAVFSSCLPLWVATIMTQLVQWSGQFLSGVYVDSSSVALLAVAQRTAMLSSFVLIAVNLVVAPQFASLYRNGNILALENLAIKSVKLIVLLALPVIGVMLIFPDFLMGLFGEEFVAGAHLLRILAVGQFINAITGSVGFLLMMSGHERDVRNVALMSGILAFNLTWLLTLQYGVIGAAAATAIAVATQNLLAVYFVKKRLGFNTLAVWR